MTYDHKHLICVTVFVEQHLLSSTAFATFLTVSHIANCKILVGSVMVHVANNNANDATLVL